MITTGGNSYKIENWIGAVVDSAAAASGNIELLLYHIGPEENARFLRPWNLSETPSREDLIDLVEDIDRHALEDVESLGWNAQRYVLRAKDSKNGKDLGSVSLRYTSNALATDGGSFADVMPPNGRGVAGLAMQQTDNSQKALLMVLGMFLDNMNRHFQRCEAQAEKQNQMVLRLFEQMEEGAGRRLERETLATAQKQDAELKYRKETAQIDRDEFLLKAGVEKLVPPARSC